MKIGSKIALFYTLLSVLTTISLLPYSIFSAHSLSINSMPPTFVKKHIDRTKALGERRNRRTEYQIIQRKYDELLPEAHEILLNMDSLSEAVTH